MPLHDARQHTIVAVVTPPGAGGVGMVRLSGPDAIGIGTAVFRSSPELGQRVRHVEFGHILDSESHEIDTGLAWVLQAPRSYTGEDTVEITGHGSCVVMETLVSAAVSRGAILAEPGEFTRRAFLNGRIDLLQAEAIVDLVQSKWRRSLESSYSQASGRLSALVDELKERLVQALTAVEVGLDFSEEEVAATRKQGIGCDVEEIIRLASRLLETFEGARRRQDGFVVAIIGPPNAGKSTLLNALLDEDRSIVTPIPGTTRDTVDGTTVWSGHGVRLVDTAGLRRSPDLIEAEGVRRARGIAEEADIVVAVFDGSRPWDNDEDPTALNLLEASAGALAVNKCDLPRRLDLSALNGLTHPTISVSALTGEGLEELKDSLLSLLPRGDLADGVGLTRQRHSELLARVRDRAEAARALIREGSLDECVSADLRDALEATGELLGEGVGEAVLDRIFAEFCIGK